jgi:alkylation response protein AidB-like acyl-CoA dehydrogenase
MNTLRDQFRDLPDELPSPGSGRTRARFDELFRIATISPTLGRLAEAHYDGAAILREAARSPEDDARYGVWAAGGPDPPTLTLRRDTWHLTGQKRWCSGASLVTHALVVAHRNGSEALVLVELSRQGVQLHAPSWKSSSFAAADTRSVSFDLDIADDDIIGPDGWYGERPGFWHGATGVAAVWAGCAQGLMDRALPRWRDDSHALAHLGAIDADLSAMKMILNAAADEIDTANNGGADGHQRALRVRHVVDAAVADVTTRVLRALGPSPFAYQEDLHRILTETDLYRRQSHAERDLEQLGRLVLRSLAAADW